MKRPPSQKMCKLRSKLQRLATEGIDHERTNAKSRPERLEGRIDFSIPIIRTGDIFAGAVEPNRGDFHSLKLDLRDHEPHACFVKWAIDSGFRIETRWRTLPDRSAELCAGVYARSVPNVAKAAAHIAESFAALWKAFRALPGATDGDARTFCLGLLDGMTGDERKAGEKLPPKAATNGKTGKGKRKALAIAPALSIHPYAVAVALGERVRLSAPLADLEADLMDAERRARLHAMPA